MNETHELRKENARLRDMVDRLLRAVNALRGLLKHYKPDSANRDTCYGVDISNIAEQARVELSGQPYAMVGGRPVVCLHGRVAVTPDGIEHEIIRPHGGEK